MSVPRLLRSRLATAACAAALALAAPARPGMQVPSPPAGGLAALFDTGGALQDRNGDGVVDFVNARFVLGDAPGDDDIAAAADIAARLGFETSAMNLPVAVGATGEGVPILVGAAGVAAAGLSPEGLGAAGLRPGQGVVAMAAVGGSSGVAVLGGDGAGTRAAAAALAGRLPHVWDPTGDTIGKVAADIRAFLAERQVTARSIDVPAAFVRAGGDALERLVVRIGVASGTEVRAAQAALSGLRPAASRPTAPPASEEAPRLSSPGAALVRIEVVADGAAPVAVDLPRAAAPPAPDGPLPRRPGAAAKAGVDLSNLYENDGLVGDSDSNLIPDRADAVVSASGPGTSGVIDLAARIGLESAGVSVPLVLPPGAVGKPALQPTLVIVGVSHPLIDQLVKDKKFERPALEPGEGVIQVVRKAFGEKSAVVVTGADARGVARAVAALAERFPHIWARGKDRTTLGDVEEDVRRLVGGRSPAGQAAIALYKLDRIAEIDLAGLDLASVHVKVAVEKAADGLEAIVRQQTQARLHAGSVDITVENLDVQRATTIIDDEFDVASEVDDFWRLLRTKVVPAVKRNRRKPVVVEARLSEPPDVRERLQREARAELVSAGAADAGTTVTVLSAYKQGFSWLNDVVKPRLAGRAVDAITIRFAEIGPPPEWKHQAMYAPTRWLMEIFPIDEVLSRDLGVDLSAIRFDRAPIGSPAYEVMATAGGAEVYRGTFEPRIVVRQFYDRFPDYERVRVTTGGLTAEVGGRTEVDERIVTDVERFWDHFQGKTLPAIYDYAMALGDGKPRPEDAPFFGELRVDLSLSEPEYRLGIDEEQISSLESMHEEIYFNTLHFFDLLGRFTRGAPLAYPGRIIPVMRPKSDGRPGRARITFTGFASPRPEVVVTYRTRDGGEGKARRDVPKAAVERPEALAALVRDGQNGIARLDLRVKVDTETDERPALVLKAREEQVDRQVMSAAQVTALMGHLSRLRAAGLYRDALAYHDLGEIRVTASWSYDGGAATEAVATLAANGSPEPWPDIRTLLAAPYRYDGRPIVQWDEPMPPREAYEVLAKMSTFEEATVYKVGESYLGHDIWAMDLMPPIEASHWSQAKATTLKPTVIYSARQHANEVSSTSHTLKLAEQLLTDPEYRRKLDKVNAVFHPITNPDGAELAYELQKTTPTHMLHAGYLGSLGVDMTSAQWDGDAIYPESRVRPDLWRTWLPDIFLNPHGYPSHEWVQMFSEYAAWIRSRIGESRDYWTMRGWWMPGFGLIDDPKYPRHKAAQLALRSFIAGRMHASAPVRALNDRAYARYTRYTFDWDKKLFKLDFTDGVLIYSAIKGAKGSPTSPSFMTRHPNVTIFEGVTEAPDETARGDWLQLVSTAGFVWDQASLDYLVESGYKVERQCSEFYGGISLSVTRPRPPKTAGEEETGAGPGGRRP